MLNQDNAAANLARKRKRTTTSKPTESAVKQADLKRPMADNITKENSVTVVTENQEEKMQEDEDSYEFAPFCENCGS